MPTIKNSLFFTTLLIIGLLIFFRGWSYGGFLSLSVLAQDSEGVFQCAASVAPVVDWRLYDTYYTVRFVKKHQIWASISSDDHYSKNICVSPFIRAQVYYPKTVT